MREKKIKYQSLYGHFAAIAATAFLAAVLSGCGRSEAEEAGTAIVQPVDAAADSDGTGVAQEAEPDGDAGGAALADDEAENSDAAAALEEMDEETRKQLTVQLLEENEKDVSATDSERSTKGCVFDVPEGFSKLPDIDGLDVYVTDRYPLDASMICYEVLQGDLTLQLMTEDMFKQEAEESLRQVYGEETVLEIDSYESVKVNDYPAFRILCHFGAEGIEITQLQYVINADKTYAITYSQTNDYDWMEAFAQSAETIRVM